MHLRKIILRFGLLFLISIFIGTYTNKGETCQTPKSEPVEIKEYQGKKLSSINDFRENSIRGPQHIDKDIYKLEITGLVDGVKIYTYEEMIRHPNYRKVATLNCVEGWSVTILWEGILVRDLIKEVGVDSTAKVVIFYAYDGYSVSFPLSYVIDNDIMMAYKMNGLILPPERGFPFQLVAENKWGYKWIKWITKIELSANEEYRGFWESRGHSNNGDLDKSFFEEPNR